MIDLNKNSTFISVLADIFSSLASVAIILTLVVALVQIYHARRHVRAQAVYAALKDVREISPSANMSDRFSLFYALFEQRRLGIWDEEAWEPVETDVRETLSSDETKEMAKKYWDDNKQFYSLKFQDWIDRLKDRK